MNLKKTLASVAALGGVFAVSAVAKADTVTVKAGDTLSALAQKYNTTVDEIVKQNHISNANLIYVGQQLQIGNNSQSQTSNQNNGQANNAAATATNNQSQSQGQSQNNNQVANTQSDNGSQQLSGSEAAAQAWIVARESGGNYNARNGQYIGKYQLSASYLGGDYSPAHQDAVANQYVASRYGSWVNAQRFWESHGWY
ncbi:MULTISPECIES: LysM peptidoglycan-binding domain-containing protein [unclassified Ligilactobacillus]|uniref:aggregation-promoting factor n=1 Tax=unclassified Ligilactobacillus TaxID=2767920 RepID=UPI003853D16C